MTDKQKIERAAEHFRKCSATFVALGDTTRQNLCMALAEAGDEGINVAQLSGKSVLSRPAVSHHLKVLKDAGIIEPLKRGTHILYRLRLRESFRPLKTLIDMVDEILAEEES